MLNSDVIR